MVKYIVRKAMPGDAPSYWIYEVMYRRGNGWTGMSPDKGPFDSKTAAIAANGGMETRTIGGMPSRIVV